MKIEIDLNDILGDENGAETLQESVRPQVIDSVSSTVKKGISAKIDAAISETITAAIQTYLDGELPALLANIMDSEYKPVGRYGEKGDPTTFRKELVKAINENMVYKRAHYDSERNLFTRAVDDVVAENLKAFRAEFQKRVDADYTTYAMAYATEQLKKKLGIA